jgi:hypothetical protein
VDSRQLSQVSTGIVVIVIGLLLLGHELHLGLDVGRMWPIVLVIAGLSRFASVDENGRRRSGGWMALAGVLLLLNNFKILGLRDSWPLFVIAAGVGIMFGRGVHRRSRRRRMTMDAGPTDAPASPGDAPGDARFPS